MSENLEAVVIKWLNTRNSSYTAYAEVPRDLPDKFITVARTGGTRESMFEDMAEILVEVYDKSSRFACSSEADAIADAMQGLVDSSPNIARATVNSIVSIDDTQIAYRRYQIYLDIVHHR